MTLRESYSFKSNSNPNFWARILIAVDTSAARAVGITFSPSDEYPIMPKIDVEATALKVIRDVLMHYMQCAWSELQSVVEIANHTDIYVQVHRLRRYLLKSLSLLTGSTRV